MELQNSGLSGWQAWLLIVSLKCLCLYEVNVTSCAKLKILQGFSSGGLQNCMTYAFTWPAARKKMVYAGYHQQPLWCLGDKPKFSTEHNLRSHKETIPFMLKIVLAILGPRGRTLYPVDAHRGSQGLNEPIINAIKLNCNWNPCWMAADRNGFRVEYIF